MAQAICFRSAVAASVAKVSPAGLPRVAKAHVKVAGLSQRLAVSASLEPEKECVRTDDGALAATMAASVFSLLASAPSATAAQLVAELADDSRPLAVLGFLIPALGWVLFNIAKPALNQLNKMQASKAIVGALGLGAAGSAALAFTEDANAAELVAQLAEDNRPFVLLLPLVAALGWVLFNIAKPALNQVTKMTGGSIPLPSITIKKPSTTKKTIKKGVIGAIGLSGAMALTESADAAQEIATLAADNRPLILLFVLLPALGWVLFNIARPALNQISKLLGEQPKGKK